MDFARRFVERPVATTLLTLAIVFAGVVAFLQLPVAPLPQVDFPTIRVSASLPGASPETMAATVTTPLERTLGRIAGVTEMTSSSALGTTSIVLQFDLSRDINGAARDVQAAINAARASLPDLPRNPSYRKVNPADAPVLILALTSTTARQSELYDRASTYLAQELLHVEGVGDVNVSGSSSPAIRVDLNPQQLAHYGISSEDVRSAIAASNANRPKGSLSDGERHWQINANDQASTPADYRHLIVRYQGGAAVRLSDLGEVGEGTQDERNAGSANGRPSVLLVIYREPGANIIETVDRIKAMLPRLSAELPGAMRLHVAADRSPMIRASLREVEHSLLLAVLLVIGVVFVFLRSARATLIPAVALPVSLIGSFAAMHLCGFSLNNLSLMALTIATGFVVDDAIVVLENAARHVEEGVAPFAAALRSVRETGFTVLAMSLSLIAVFIPVLLMGGVVGRLFREFALTLSVAILISLLISLTTTPMMCARLLRAQPAAPSRWARASERALGAVQGLYERSLARVTRHGIVTLLVLLATVCLNVWLYTIVPKGFFPQQDTGRIDGSIRGDQSISFQAMRGKLAAYMKIIQADPAVDSVTGYTGGSRTNSGSMFIQLKPLGERQDSAQQVIDRLRIALDREPGARLYLSAAQDLRIGARSGGAQYQFTLQADDLDSLREWEPKVRLAMFNLPELQDVNTDDQEKGLRTLIEFDRDAMARLGVSTRAADAALNNAYGQRQISTIYRPLNQYRVVMQVDKPFRQGPEALDQLFVVNSRDEVVPFSAFAHYTPTYTSLGVNHQSGFAASTISFNLTSGVALSQAQDAIQHALAVIGVPSSIHGSFEGSARTFQATMQSLPWLIVAALLTVYIVLGMLYESYVHPLTILSTLPSAGVGALLALLATREVFSLVALIGVLLLIGIVMKNAIMMIDCALETERSEGVDSRRAILSACARRFRPILMTTLAALLGAVPLALGAGDGAELRRPLGLTIIGGLLLSQLLTLYTTPVVYLYLDRFRLWCARRRAARKSPAPAGGPAA